MACWYFGRHEKYSVLVAATAHSEIIPTSLWTDPLPWLHSLVYPSMHLCALFGVSPHESSFVVASDGPITVPIALLQGKVAC
jgi:hypothetical protein